MVRERSKKQTPQKSSSKKNVSQRKTSSKKLGTKKRPVKKTFARLAPKRGAVPSLNELKEKAASYNLPDTEQLEKRLISDCGNLIKLSESGQVDRSTHPCKVKCTPHFYVDKNGLSIGYGSNVIANPHLLGTLDLKTKEERSLSLEEKRAFVQELRACASDSKKFKALTEKYTVTEESSHKALNIKLKECVQKVMWDFKAQGVDPHTVDPSLLKVAIDINYNTGRFFTQEYPQFFEKIKNGKYTDINEYDYRTLTGPIKNPNNPPVNKQREEIKGLLVAQAKDINAFMKENPLPENASVNEIADYKSKVFSAVWPKERERYKQLTNGDLLFPDAIKTLSFAIDTKINGGKPLNEKQMAASERYADRQMDLGVTLPLSPEANKSRLSAALQAAIDETDINKDFLELSRNSQPPSIELFEQYGMLSPVLKAFLTQDNHGK